MDLEELLAGLRELDQLLAGPVEILVVGGAAMILHFGARRATLDVDYLLLQGEAIAFRSAVAAVASSRGLPHDWMNDAVKGFVDILPPDFTARLTSLELGLQNLRVDVLSRPEQAAMKLVALREADLEDLELLLPRLTPAEQQILIRTMEHLAAIRPDWALRMRLFLEEQGWQIS
jgi:hypothetical protein